MIYYIGFCAISKVLPVGKEASTTLFIGEEAMNWLGESQGTAWTPVPATLVSKRDRSA